MKLRLGWVIVLALWVAWPCSGIGATNEAGKVVSWIFSEGPELRSIPFSEVVAAASGRQVLALGTNDAERVFVGKLSGALDAALATMNRAGAGKRRINEVSALFEEEIRRALNRVEGFECRFSPTREGKVQRAGYPDLYLVDRGSGRRCYLDPKLYERGARGSSFRTFYFEPKEQTGKILHDAHHLLVGIEHDGVGVGQWKFLSWELIDLSRLKVRLKAEFQASNRDLYRDDTVVGRSGGGAPGPKVSPKR